MGFILIDFKKRGERKELHKLPPKLLRHYDLWVATAEDSTPTEEECTAMEEAKMEELLGKFDKTVEPLWRVKDEAPKVREEFVKDLNKRRGDLYLSFSDQVGALKKKAKDLLVFCHDSYLAFEKDQLESYPVLEQEIETELAEFLEQTRKHIEETYPDGVAGLDAFDDELPDGVKSFSDWEAEVKDKEGFLKESNQASIPTAMDKLKENTLARARTAFNEAIAKATEEIVTDLSDDSLPYLDEEQMASLREELIESVKSYSATRIDG